MLQLATVRLLEIVGEAANRVPPQVRGRYPAVPWREVISLRNRVVHGYDTVDLNVVWQVVKSDLPQLLRDLDAIIAQEESAQ